MNDLYLASSAICKYVIITVLVINVINVLKIYSFNVRLNNSIPSYRFIVVGEELYIFTPSWNMLFRALLIFRNSDTIFPACLVCFSLPVTYYIVFYI